MIKRIYLNDKQNPANIIYPITDEQSVRDGNGVTLATKLSDLPQVKEGAALGRTAYQKPVTGIPASDIAEGVIPNVTNFVTKSVNDLVNYYTKSQTYTKEEVANLIAAIQQFHYEVVASTSAVTSPSNNVLYLVGPTGSGSDKYEEYVYDSTKDNPWIKIGDTSIDLSGYVTIQSLNTILSNYVTSSDLVSALSNKQDTLVSGTNIKTVNGESILGSGNITAGDPNAVKYTEQSLTDAQKAQARTNIGAGTYSKPSEGIPASDLASGVVPTVPTISTDINADATSDVKTTSPKAVKTFVEGKGYGTYSKPSGGIPENDFSQLVKDKLNAKEVFIAEYGVTTIEEVNAALDAGKVVFAKYYDAYLLPGSCTESLLTFYQIDDGICHDVMLDEVDGWSMTEWALEKQSNKKESLSGYENDNRYYLSTKGVYDAIKGLYTKPQNGIPASDIALGVIPDAVSANPIVPSGTTPTPLTGLKIGSNYYDVEAGGIITDVTVGGISVVNASGVAEIPAIPYETESVEEVTLATVATTGNYTDLTFPNVGTLQPSGGMLPNILYNLGTLSGNTTFSFATPADENIVNHYYFTFDTSSTAPTITWPAAITSWFGGSAPTINASKHYEISVLNGVGLYVEV